MRFVSIFWVAAVLSAQSAPDPLLNAMKDEL